jgi:hypothetical protein
MNPASPSSRRGFLKTTGAATALASAAGAGMAGVAKAPALPRLSAAEHAGLHALALADFAPLLGQSFQVYAPGHAALLTLARAEALPVAGDQAPRAGRSQPFSLEFHGALGTALQPGLHEFQHAALGRLALSLNPIGRQQAGTAAVYQVVFG